MVADITFGVVPQNPVKERVMIGSIAAFDIRLINYFANEIFYCGSRYRIMIEVVPTV